MSTIKGVIFDFDGVLVLTEKSTFKFYQKLLPKYGFNLKDEDFNLKAGRKSLDFFKDVMRDKFDESIVNEWVNIKRKAFISNPRKYVELAAGAENLLKNLLKSNYRLAIGSQNEKEMIEATLDEFKISKYFKSVFSLQDIKKKKPDPEVFLLASKSLNLQPKECLIIEDSPHGIEGAKSGGFKSLALTTSFDKTNFSKADYVFSNLLQISIEFIKAL